MKNGESLYKKRKNGENNAKKLRVENGQKVSSSAAAK